MSRLLDQVDFVKDIHADKKPKAILQLVEYTCPTTPTENTVCVSIQFITEFP